MKTMCKNLINNKMDIVSFKDEIVEPHPSLINSSYYNFVTKNIYIKNAYIDISKVIGTSHPDYANSSWKCCFENLKRKEANIDSLDCIEKIKYYTDKNYRPFYIDPWSINIINGKYYITQGNHRSIIAKFLSYLKIIPKKQFGLSFLEYKTYNEKEHNRFDKFELWLKTQKYVPFVYLPKYYVKRKEIRKIEKSSKYCITYYKPIYYIINYHVIDGYIQPVHSRCKNLLIFKSVMFDEIRKIRKNSFILITLYKFIKLLKIG